jgi:CHAT domain-containing protein/Tfp pilus assembly protein PilF
MKNTKAIFILIILILCSVFSYGQNITSDTTLANTYKNKADQFNINRKRDSSVIYYQKASEIYWRYYEIENKIILLQRYLHCQSNLSYDLAFLGKNKEAFTIANNSVKLCENNQANTKELFARSYLAMAFCYENKQDFETAIEYYEKSLDLYNEIKDTNNIYVARIYSSIGIIYYYYGMYKDALEYLKIAQEIIIENYGKETSSSAALYNVMGIISEALGKFELSLDYKQKALSIFIKIDGNESVDVAHVYLNLGGLYQNLVEYDKAMDCYKKTLGIYMKLYGENNVMIADVYNNMAVVYNDKEEYNSALEYYLFAKDIYVALLDENDIKLATVYNNIGVVYEITGKYNLALDYYNKALTIRKKILGNKHPDVAVVYGNVGVLYLMSNNYDLAIDYLTKSLQIKEKVYGKNHIEITTDLFNLGRTYKEKSDIEKSLDYYTRVLEIRKRYYGEKHPNISLIYSNIGVLYYDNNEFEKSLSYFQNALIALIKDYNNKETNSVPTVNQVDNSSLLLTILSNKVQIFYDKKTKESLLLALDNVYACDTLINQMLKSAQKKADKLNIGEKAFMLYAAAYDICYELFEMSVDTIEREKYLKEILYFSEKNKSTVLLSALFSAEAKEFAGLPDSLLQYESKLASDLDYFKKELTYETDSSNIIAYRRNIFQINRKIDSLIVKYEEDYPNYYDLKYNNNLVSLCNVQSLLDNKTLIISYLSIDSLISCLLISKDTLQIEFLDIDGVLIDLVKEYRYGLTYTNSSRFSAFYKKQAYNFYKQLIPENIDNEIENLIMIPDAELSMIPFETLLTEEAGDKDWSELPYLIKKYNISYSYSANLFYKTFPKEHESNIESTDLNDWLAFAPVFDDAETAGLTLRTRELLRDFESNINDTLNTRGRLVDGGYISPLPGTESEVQSIFKEFDDKGKKAQVQIKNNANEEYIKSGGLKEYKLLHFATHGFVNEEKPELSGIFLAQDSTLSEDGILYQGEIYNLDLNADLTVLSACETGLGQIKRGEGIIGLTRALLYAGSKNIIVSLWKVADESTSDLMIDFYKNLLNENQETKEYSKALQQAKLKMINEEKYAHPFYWSPFILIGK